MSIKVQVYGDKIDLADELQEEFHAVAKDVVKEAADLWLAEIRRLLSLRAGPPAAPEGEPPAYRTKDLMDSFKRIPARVRGRVASSGIRSDHEGANRVNVGFTDSRGVRTLPHPFVEPSRENIEPAVTALLTEKLSG